MTGNDCYLVGVVACEMSVDEDEKIRHSAGEWYGVREECPSPWICVEDDGEK